MNATTTIPAAPNEAATGASLRLKAVLIAVSVACMAAFVYGNARGEEFRLAFPRFHPWLWNLYLTCAIAGVVGNVALWWSRRWGFWTLLASGLLASAIGFYAMRFTLIGAVVALALGVVWMAVQPDWRNLR